MLTSLFRQGVEEAKYKVELQPAEGAVQVSDGAVSVLVSLTSAVMREPAGEYPLLVLVHSCDVDPNFTLYYLLFVTLTSMLP